MRTGRVPRGALVNTHGHGPRSGRGLGSGLASELPGASAAAAGGLGGAASTRRERRSACTTHPGARCSTDRGSHLDKLPPRQPRRPPEAAPGGDALGRDPADGPMSGAAAVTLYDGSFRF